MFGSSLSAKRNPESNDLLGFSSSVASDRLLVGIPGDNDGNGTAIRLFTPRATVDVVTPISFLFSQITIPATADYRRQFITEGHTLVTHHSMPSVLTVNSIIHQPSPPEQ